MTRMRIIGSIAAWLLGRAAAQTPPTPQNCRASFALEAKVCPGHTMCHDERLEVNQLINIQLVINNRCHLSKDESYQVQALLPEKATIEVFLAIDKDGKPFKDPVLDVLEWIPIHNRTNPTHSSFQHGDPNGPELFPDCNSRSCGIITMNVDELIEPGGSFTLGEFRARTLRLPEKGYFGQRVMRITARTEDTGLVIQDPACRFGIRGGAAASTVAAFLEVTTTTTTTMTTTTTTMAGCENGYHSHYHYHYSHDYRYDNHHYYYHHNLEPQNAHTHGSGTWGHPQQQTDFPPHSHPRRRGSAGRRRTCPNKDSQQDGQGQSMTDEEHNHVHHNWLTENYNHGVGGNSGPGPWWDPHSHSGNPYHNHR